MEFTKEQLSELAYGKRKQITRPDGDNAGDTPYVPLLEQYLI